MIDLGLPLPDCRDKSIKQCGRSLARLLAGTTAGQQRQRTRQDFDKHVAQVASREASKLGSDVTRKVFLPNSATNKVVSGFLDSAAAHDPLGALTSTTGDGMPLDVAILISSVPSVFNGCRGIDQSGMIAKLALVRSRLAKQLGAKICLELGARHALDTAAVTDFAMAIITFRFRDARLDLVLKDIDSQVNQRFKVSTKLDLLAPGVLRCLGVSRAVMVPLLKVISPVLCGLRSWDSSAVEAFLDMWSSCISASGSATFVRRLEGSLNEICGDITEHRAVMLRGLGSHHKWLLDTWRIQSGPLPPRVTHRAFSELRGAALLRLEAAIDGAGYLAEVQELIAAKPKEVADGFDDAFDAAMGAGRLQGAQAGDSSPPVGVPVPPAAPPSAGWTAQGLNSVAWQDVKYLPKMLEAVSDHDATLRGHCLYGRLFVGACTRTGCTFTHDGAVMLPDGVRQRILEAGGVAPR